MTDQRDAAREIFEITVNQWLRSNIITALEGDETLIAMADAVLEVRFKWFASRLAFILSAKPDDEIQEAMLTECVVFANQILEDVQCAPRL